MLEVFEFRIPEETARQYLPKRVGSLLGGSVRKILVSKGDPIFETIRRADQEMRAKGKRFFLFWDSHRRYSTEEMDSTEIFHLQITAVFEPTGEMCGTGYDYSAVCTHCRAGRKQTTDLMLDLRKVPKTKDIARTIARDEWIVSHRLAELLVDSKLTGFELRPVRHKARYEDDAIDLRVYPTGRELLDRAERAGFPHPSWEFWVWVNRPEGKELLERAYEEHAKSAQKRKSARSRNASSPWYQLVIKSRPISIVPPTCVGENPFHEDTEGRFRCPEGHVVGLNLLSEITVSRTEWDKSDFARTSQCVGEQGGEVYPAPLLVVSQRVRKLFYEHRIRGCMLEVAHLK